MSDTIDTEQCAELLHCKPDQVEELARTGEIPGLKLGRSWLFIRSDLLAYLAEKARSEAQDRRAKRQPAANVREISARARRRPPPALPARIRPQ